MSKDKRTGWLAELKPGSVVIVAGHRREDKLARVDRITPSGRMVIGGRTYNPDGSSRGGGPWSFGTLVRPTPDRVSAIERKANEARFRMACREASVSADCGAAWASVLAAACALGLTDGGAS